MKQLYNFDRPSRKWIFFEVLSRFFVLHTVLVTVPNVSFLVGKFYNVGVSRGISLQLAQIFRNCCNIFLEDANIVRLAHVGRLRGHLGMLLLNCTKIVWIFWFWNLGSMLVSGRIFEIYEVARGSASVESWLLLHRTPTREIVENGGEGRQTMCLCANRPILRFTWHALAATWYNGRRGLD